MYVYLLPFSFLLFGWSMENHVWWVYSHSVHRNNSFWNAHRVTRFQFKIIREILARAFLANDSLFYREYRHTVSLIFTAGNTGGGGAGGGSNWSYCFPTWDFCPQGKIACVCTSSMLRNTQTGHQRKSSQSRVILGRVTKCPWTLSVG